MPAIFISTVSKRVPILGTFWLCGSLLGPNYYRISIFSVLGRFTSIVLSLRCRLQTHTILPDTDTSSTRQTVSQTLYTQPQGQRLCLAHWSCLEVSSSLGGADTHSTLLLLLPPPAPLLSSWALTTKMTSDDIKCSRNHAGQVSLVLHRGVH